MPIREGGPVGFGVSSSQKSRQPESSMERKCCRRTWKRDDSPIPTVCGRRVRAKLNDEGSMNPYLRDEIRERKVGSTEKGLRDEWR